MDDGKVSSLIISIEFETMDSDGTYFHSELMQIDLNIHEFECLFVIACIGTKGYRRQGCVCVCVEPITKEQLENHHNSNTHFIAQIVSIYYHKRCGRCLLLFIWKTE